MLAAAGSDGVYKIIMADEGVTEAVLSELLASVRQAQYDLDCCRLRVAHICSHKKQGYLAKSGNGEADPKSPAEYKATHDK